MQRNDSMYFQIQLRSSLDNLLLHDDRQTARPIHTGLKPSVTSPENDYAAAANGNIYLVRYALCHGQPINCLGWGVTTPWCLSGRKDPVVKLSIEQGRMLMLLTLPSLVRLPPAHPHRRFVWLNTPPLCSCQRPHQRRAYAPLTRGTRR